MNTTMPNGINSERWEDEQRRRAEYVEWLNPHTRAEWIDGAVVFLPPQTWGQDRVIDALRGLIRGWAGPAGLGKARSNLLVRFARNDYLPDLCFWPAQVVATFNNDDTFLFPPPALVVEVLSDSTRKNDRGIKLEDYAAGGVTEYWIVDAEALTLEQYVLADGRYDLRGRFDFRAGGTVECVAVAGLTFPVAAAFDESANAQAVAATR